MAARIDLGWLAQLLTPTPTASGSINPNYNPDENIPYTDPVTGQTSGIMPNNTPYVTPSKWQQMVWPQQSGVINNLNTQAVAEPSQSNLENLSNLSVRKSNINRSGLVPPGETADQYAAQGGGSLNTSPEAIRSGLGTIGYLRGGGTDLDVMREHNVASAQIEEAANRAREAATRGLLGNPEAAATTENKGLTYQGGEYGGLTALQPQKFERMGTEERLGTEEARSALSLLPQRTELQRIGLGTEIPLAETRRSLLPYTERQMGNEALGGALSSQYLPPSSLFGTKLDIETGTATPRQILPTGMSPAQQELGGIKMLTGQSQQTITLPSGKKITVNVPTQSNQPIDVLGNRGGVGVSVGGGSNNVTRSATPVEHSGDMNPPVPTSSSSNTLTRPSINQPLPQPEQDLIYPKALNEEPNTHQKISDEISKITSKYQGRGAVKMSDEDIARLRSLTNALSTAQ